MSPVQALRKRRPIWDEQLAKEIPALQEVQEFLNEDDSSLLDDEDGYHGCPLPSTPVDPASFDREVVEALRSGGLGTLMHNAHEAEKEFMRKVWAASWSVCNFRHLPSWLQDNDYLHNGHRPPLPSFSACFKSIFRIHTETGNIWTHLLGCIAFSAGLLVYMTRSEEELPLPDKLALGTYFIGAIICLGFSFTFHTVYCHSEFVGKLFSKLDYCGIAIQITGSFVPWLYYSFYCKVRRMMVYLSFVIILGIASIVVSLWDKFSESRFRPWRAGIFAIFGLSGVVPAVHYVIEEGWVNAITYASLDWLILMGFLYLLGAALYAFRVPECFFPGRFDIWFQSHQIFHVLVIAAAFVHLHGITEMLTYRMSIGACAVQSAATVL
ncbi:receptor [Nesidiocoris tenuis]|nr:receptor [Nesidiocoris tenuis]